MAALRLLREKLGLRRSVDRLPAHVSIGRHTYGLRARNFIRPSPKAPISVGSYCSFGPDVMIFGQADHPTHLVSTYPFRAMIFTPEHPDADATTPGGAVCIGHDVWGRRLGDHPVGGQHRRWRGDRGGCGWSRATLHPMPVAGSPARQIKLRLPEDQIVALRSIRWWDWPDEKLARFKDVLYGDVAAFIARVAAENAA
ncbi:MAG: hypothetical protein U1E97_07995 [Alphaproteobacteria bacterium]